MTKSSVKNHLRFYWWSYVLIAIAVAFVWIAVYFIAYSEKSDEQLTVVLIGGEFEGDKFAENLLSDIKKDGDEKIKKINVINSVPADKDALIQTLWTRSLDSDLIIVTENCLIDGVGGKYFIEIEAFEDGNKNYIENGKVYGLITGENGSYLTTYYKGGQICTIFKGVSAKDKTESVQKVLKVLLSEG